MALLVVILLVGANLSSQEALGGNYLTEKISLEEGLPHREVRSTVLDTNGLMWISTPAGLVRYDGHTFTTANTLAGQFKGKLSTGRDGLIYCQLEDYPDSVEVYNPYRFERFGFRFSSAGNMFFGGLYQPNSGDVKLLRGQTIYALTASTDRKGGDPAEFCLPSPRPLHLLPSPILSTTRLIYADTTGYLLYRPGHLDLLYTTNGRSVSHSLPPGSLPTGFHHHPTIGTIGLTKRGVYLNSQLGGKSRWIKYDGLPDKAFNYVAKDEVGNLLLGYVHPVLERAEYLYLVSDGEVTDLSWVVGIEDRIVTITGRDFREAMTLATYGGVQLISFPEAKPSRFQRHMYDEKVGKSHFGHIIRGFTADADGYVYTNEDSRANAWYRIAPDRSTVDTLTIQDEFGREVEQSGYGSNMVTVGDYVYGHSCLRTADSVSGHLYRYHPVSGKWKQFHLPGKNFVIRYLLPDTARGVIWMATEKYVGPGLGKLYQFDYRTETITEAPIIGPVGGFRAYPRKMVLAPGAGSPQSGTKAGPAESIYIGGTEGFYRYNIASGRLTEYHLPDGKPTRILEVTPYRDSVLLVGSFGMGLYEFDTQDETFTWKGGKLEQGAIKRSDDFIVLPNNDVAGVAVTPAGGLIITTFSGLVLYQDGKSSVFTTKDGLGNNEFNTTSLFWCKLTDDWFAGGINGFVVFNLEDLLPKASDYKPVLLQYSALDEDLGSEMTRQLPPEPTGPLVIPPSVAYFTLDFALPDYSLLGAPKYETQLTGYDPGWRASVATPSVRYTRLPAGKYEFRLRAIDAFGDLTREMPPLSIRVLKPWYQSRWFYLATALAVVTLVFLAIRLRIRRLQNKLQTQQRLHELELRTVRQQMNPHFISNAMNAIREYIYNEKPTQAANYLTDFTRLMRLFLESSRKPMTTIADEKLLLQHYIRLEQLRFPGKFDYRIIVDEAIDPEMDEVPSFLLQPVVENAINHGLFPLEAGGELVISFSLTPAEGYIICKVTDNGIGRAAAAARSRYEDHVSRSTQILEDRRLMWADNEDFALDIQVADLTPSAPHPGTSVQLIIKSHLAV